jgi:hypothetical protein
MGYQQHEFEEPEQPKEKRWLVWLGVGAIVLFLVGICIVGASFLFRQFESRTAPPPTLVVPTSSVATAVPEPTDPPLAPTATVQQDEPGPEPATAVPLEPGAVEASQLPVPPAIDGDLSEWSVIAATESSFRVYSHSSWDGSDDVSAAWRLAWDANNLYIGVSVTDDAHVQNQTGNQIFRGDSVDMQFDTDKEGDFGDGLSPDDFQITFSPGDFAGLPPSAFRFQGTSNGRILDAPGGNQVTVSAQPTALGYNLEAAIPWSDLSLTPSSGLVIGLALNVSDNDAPGTAVQEVMKSHISTRTLTNPAGWGTLVLK